MALRSRNSSAITAVTLIALACALAGCGRKGNLDLPPSTSSYQAAPGVLDDTSAAPESATSQGNVYQTDSNADKTLVAPKGPKKRIILDPILD
ncbi:MAG: lipoprotein [Rhizobiales bacterium]|nr:lipoprotein [Hyphomicrobiales bacterium]